MKMPNTAYSCILLCNVAASIVALLLAIQSRQFQNEIQCKLTQLSEALQDNALFLNINK